MKKALYYDGQFMGHSEVETIEQAIKDLGIDIKFDELDVDKFEYKPAKKYCSLKYFKDKNEFWLVDSKTETKLHQINDIENVTDYRLIAVDMGYICV
jgi:hypothetical protein